MTLVAVWVNYEQIRFPSVWGIADTMISNHEGALTLEGSKILELPITCKNYSHSWGKPYFSGSFGFAYAGSSLVGLNTFATMSTILTNIGGGDERHYIVPKHTDVVNKAAEILALYVRSVQNPADVCIWGFCPKLHLPFIATIKSSMKAGEVQFVVTYEYGDSDKLQCVLIGSHTEEVYSHMQEMKEAFQGKKDDHYWRIPLYLLRTLIREHRYHDVSGNIQIASVAANHQVNHYSMVVPIPGSDPVEYTFKYRNIDYFSEIGQRLGECCIGIPALDLDFPHQPNKQNKEPSHQTTDET